MVSPAIKASCLKLVFRIVTIFQSRTWFRCKEKMGYISMFQWDEEFHIPVISPWKFSEAWFKIIYQTLILY